jgi:hypothetical protein
MDINLVKGIFMKFFLCLALLVGGFSANAQSLKQAASEVRSRIAQVIVENSRLTSPLQVTFAREENWDEYIASSMGDRFKRKIDIAFADKCSSAGAVISMSTRTQDLVWAILSNCYNLNP